MKTNQKIAVLGLFTAIIILLANTVGFIPIGPLAVTILHIPVIACAFLYGRAMGASLGLIFGLVSLFRAYTQPSPTSFIMMNPLVSVVPRLAFGYLSGLIYEKLIANKSHYKLRLALGAGLATAIHSILVLGSLWLIYSKAYVEVLDKAVGAIILASLANMAGEIIVAALVVPALVVLVKRK